MPTPHPKKHSLVRGFERTIRLQALLNAGLLASASDLPADAVPAAVAAARRTGRLFYRDSPFHCRDCGAESVWSAEEQCFWFERADGPRQSVAVRCTSCRRKLKERDTPKSSRAA